MPLGLPPTSTRVGEAFVSGLLEGGSSFGGLLTLEAKADLGSRFSRVLGEGGFVPPPDPHFQRSWGSLRVSPL